jgi:hypothetical protein
MLVPAARAIQKILAAPTTCDCIRDAVERMTDAMEQLEEIHSLAPRPQTH